MSIAAPMLVISLIIYAGLFGVFVNKKVSQKGVKKVSTFNTQ